MATGNHELHICPGNPKGCTLEGRIFVCFRVIFYLCIMGKWLIILGVILIIAGLAIHFQVKIPWLGKLPGDIRIESGNTKIYIPLATSLLLSLILTLIFYLIRVFRG